MENGELKLLCSLASILLMVGFLYMLFVSLTNKITFCTFAVTCALFLGWRIILWVRKELL